MIKDRTNVITMQGRSRRMLHTFSKTPLDSIVGVVGVCRCQLCSDLSSIDEKQQARPTG